LLKKERVFHPGVWFAVVLALWLLAAGQPAEARSKGKQLSAKDMNKLYGILATGDHYKVRIHAAKVLGMLRKHESLPHLIKALRKDPDHLVRSTSAWALGAINHPGAIMDLHRASKKEVALVKKQAQRALNHVLSSFPGNLRAGSHLGLTLHGLGDEGSDDGELAKWIQQYLLDHLVKYENVELGTEMNIEEDGELPDIDESFKPLVQLSFFGGVTKVTVPDDRAAGPVKVEIEVGLKLEPMKQIAFKKKKYRGHAEFAGGDKPADEWTDDPLVETQKEALKAAADKAFKGVAVLLKLKK